ncbi:hypothetical protein NQZ68_035842 [Dissostichus eleginoides]|nr:hypothetical protein NQZ68_035842 [Dissostichus eleginoides]
MWWLACCLGYSLLQKFRPTRLITDAKVVHRLARSFQSTRLPQGWPYGTLEWIQGLKKPSLANKEVPFSSSDSPHPPARNHNSKTPLP